MQLLDSVKNQPTTAINPKLQTALSDIINKVEIHPDFCIRHPDYKPWELPAEIVERLRKMPEQMQQKYLSLQLRSFLYSFYYNGSMQNSLTSNEKENGVPLDLENNAILGVDVGFYERLHTSNSGTGYFDSGWSILKEETDGSLAVTKGGLRLHIQRDKHLQPQQRTATIGDLVAIKKPKNLVQNGFYMAVGNLGSNRPDYLESKSVLVRVYFNLSPEGAVAVMANLTQKLNDIGVYFSFKVLYNPKDYQRHDSGVLYFDRRDYQPVKEILSVVYRENQQHFKSDIPLFTKQLAPGLALAEEPDQKFTSVESFGMNRCQIIANGLLSAWNKGDNSPEARMEAIEEQFTLLGISLHRTHLNVNSEDIYHTICL
ncbi:MAG: T3SS effector HopA1 family protein [Nostocaceae cyanobacterium]|nr:T3SS effector HopA1 family protein [Nostocaceae cyanobacterium]